MAEKKPAVEAARPGPSFLVALGASLGLLHPQILPLEAAPFKGGRSAHACGSAIGWAIPSPLLRSSAADRSLPSFALHSPPLIEHQSQAG